MFPLSKRYVSKVWFSLHVNFPYLTSVLKHSSFVYPQIGRFGGGPFELSQSVASTGEISESFADAAKYFHVVYNSEIIRLQL